MIRDNEYAVVTIKMNVEDQNWFNWAINKLQDPNFQFDDTDYVYNKMKDLLL